MAGCGHSGTTCMCAIQGDEGIKVRGSGSPSDPYRISADLPDFTDSFIVTDSDTVNLELVGAGTALDPLRLSAHMKARLVDLPDVGDPAAPSVGDVPVWQMDASGGGWYFQPPPAVAAGTLSKRTVSGLIGDGSGLNPIGVSVSGIWGVNVGDAEDEDTTGQPVYIDSAGQLRAAPIGTGGLIPWDSITGEPTIFPSNWVNVAEKPTTFPTTWDQVAGKPVIAVTGHNHNDLYYTKTESNARFPLAPPAGFFGGRAVLDVTGANKMGLRWNGSRVVMRADNSEWEVANVADLQSINAASDVIRNTKANAFEDVNTVRYARGPDDGAYARSVSGGGFFAVWMDNSLQFGRNTSSEKYKRNIETVDLGLDTALALADQVVTFERIDSLERYELGVIAERVAPIFPAAITYWADPDVEEVEEVRHEVITDDSGTHVRTFTETVQRAVPGVSSKPLEIDGVRYDLLSLPALQGVRALHGMVLALQKQIDDLTAAQTKEA